MLADLEILVDLEISGIVLYSGRGFLLIASPATSTGATIGSEITCVKAESKLISPSAGSISEVISVSFVVGLGFLFCAGDEGKARVGCGGLNLKSKSGAFASCTLFMRLSSACEVLIAQEPLAWRSGICVGLTILNWFV